MAGGGADAVGAAARHHCVRARRALWMVAGNNMKPDVHKLTRKKAAVAAAQVAMSRL
eukprot:COSAG01_NODE_5654_length_4115_cov_4.459412_3_plen_57_part_00